MQGQDKILVKVGTPEEGSKLLSTLETGHSAMPLVLDPDDVIDELIRDHLIGENAAQKITQPMGWSRQEKNRIIVDQLTMSGPGAVEKFCEIIRRKKRQIFIAEELEKCEQTQYCIAIYSKSPLL